MTQRVAVTGGSGKLGRAVVADLLEHGWEVHNLDVAAPPAPQGCEFTRIDLTDYGQVVEALSGIDDRYAGWTPWCTSRRSPVLASHRTPGRSTTT